MLDKSREFQHAIYIKPISAFEKSIETYSSVLVTCLSYLETRASVLPILAHTRNIHHPINRIGHFCFPFQWSTDASHVPRLSELANGLLLRLMVVVEETLKDLGVSPEELREVQRKRSYITACYFQAVTCY